MFQSSIKLLLLAFRSNWCKCLNEGVGVNMNFLKWMKANLFPKKGEKFFKLIVGLWTVVFLFLLFFISFFCYLFFIGSPSFEQLENPKYDLASFIYDVEGKVIGKYFVENREQVAYDSINPLIVKSLVNTEDIRFFEHTGVDYRALWRVGVKTLVLGEKQSGGGSTITQQLAKLLYKRPPISELSSIQQKINLVMVKLKEWVTSIKLEHNYTKEEIIAIYLNKFEFVNGAHGIQSAAKIYFGKDQKELDLSESALLIGMLQNPSFYNPVRFPSKAQKRRNEVLHRLVDNGIIDQYSIDSLLEKKVDMTSFRTVAPTEGPAPYFRNEVTKMITQLFDENGIRKPDGSLYNVFLDGLKIYTTIDLEYQLLAEQAMSEHMTWIQDRYWKVWKGKDPLRYGVNSEALKETYQDLFMKHVRESDRYQALRTVNLLSLDDDANDLQITELIIQRLIEVESGKYSWTDFQRKNKIEKVKLQKFKDLLTTENWKIVKESYLKLQEEFEREFSQKIELEVFDHRLGKKKMNMTPLDSVMYHLQHLQGGLLAVEPKSGEVRAWVGGLNFNYFKYDHCTAYRQVGSTIKPFIYATAMQTMGIKPCQTFMDMPYTIKAGEAQFKNTEEWKPNNSTENFTYNPYNLYQALLYSKNSITVKLMKEIGDVEKVRDQLDKVGMDKNKRMSNGQLAVPNLPAVCLGAIDATLFDMVGAYTVFVNDGVYSKPVIIRRIEDRYGRVIFDGFSPKQSAIDPLTSSVMLDMLQNNCKRDFTFKFKSKAGGKTGTTNDYVDGWFLGFTPNLVVGTWCGGDERFVRFTTLDDGQGFVTARPLFEKFILKLEQNSKKYDANKEFTTPDPRLKSNTNCSHFKVIRPEMERQLRAELKNAIGLRKDSILYELRVN